MKETGWTDECRVQPPWKTWQNRFEYQSLPLSDFISNSNSYYIPPFPPRFKEKTYLIGKYPETLLKKSTFKLDLFQDVCVVIVYGVRHVDVTVEVTAVTQNYFARVSLETRRRKNLFYFLQIPRASKNEWDCLQSISQAVVFQVYFQRKI